MSADTTKYTGRILPGPGKDEVHGWLTDAWGWSITITGVRDTAGGGYLLTGTLGDPPKALRVPAIDDEV